MEIPEEEKPLLDYIFVDLDSTQLNLLFQRIHQNIPVLLQNYICTRCWGIIERHQRGNHSLHNKFLIPGLHVSSQELYIETARKYGLIQNNQIAVLRPEKEIYYAYKNTFGTLGTIAGRQQVSNRIAEIEMQSQQVNEVMVEEVESILETIQLIKPEAGEIGHCKVADIRYLKYEMVELQNQVVNLNNLVDMLTAIRQKTMSKNEACKMYIDKQQLMVHK